MIWLAGCIFLFWAGKNILRREHLPSAIDYQSTDGKSYELVEDDALPKYPSPIIVTNRRGRAKWTVSIPPGLPFPLPPTDYADICAQAQDISRHVEDLKYHREGDHAIVHAAHYAYYYNDPHYMDVGQAEAHGLLASPSQSHKSEAKKICEKSLTYVLDSSNAGFGRALLGLWLAYGLAKAESRAFFLDDTKFPYGRYSTFFTPPPLPDCAPPPETQRVPCPHQARHLVVSAATTQYTFGHAFNDAYEDGHKMGAFRQKEIFQMMRTGYEALFHLTDDDKKYLQEWMTSLNGKSRERGGLQVGIHIRHGDRHPYEFQYQKSYIPLPNYIETAQQILEDSTGSEEERNATALRSRLLIASDDPDVYESPELEGVGAMRAQMRLSLASQRTAPDESGQMVWEGGFFRNVFWSLGLSPEEEIPRIQESPRPSKRDVGTAKKAHGSNSMVQMYNNPTADALRLREFVGRAYLLDLSVLGQADRVICTVSSSTCRVLAIMMGWDRAMEKKEWTNVDGDFEWRSIDW